MVNTFDAHMLEKVQTLILSIAVSAVAIAVPRIAPDVQNVAIDAENLHSPQRKYRLADKGRRIVS